MDQSGFGNDGPMEQYQIALTVDNDYLAEKILLSNLCSGFDDGSRRLEREESRFPENQRNALLRWASSVVGLPLSNVKQVSLPE